MKDSLEFLDLFSFDPSTAEEFGIPVNQCKAMILLFPLGGENDVEEEKVVTDNWVERIKFIKQTIDNSCCLMALLHILLNDELLLDVQKAPRVVVKLKESSNGLEELIEESEELAKIHKEVAGFGETNLSESELEDVNFHFVALVPARHSSGIVLLDGRRGEPVFYDGRGEFFEMACRVAREEFVEKSADQTNFASVILI